MKILVIGSAKLKLMPYASFYLEQIDFSKNQVDMVYWNRDLQPEDLSAYNPEITFYEFREPMDDWIKKTKKIIHFYRYYRYVSHLLKANNYDFIICLDTMPGIILRKKLSKYYKGKYILDYRDSSYESNKLFSSLLDKLALNSKLVFVSSDAFRRFLPDDKVETITSHNIISESLLHREDRTIGYIPSSKIRISFWGLLRHTSHNIKIISRLGNDPRFEIHYYGKEGETGAFIRDFIAENSINNVFLHGEYVPSARYDFVKKTDIIHNSYFDANTLLAMGNKYYDGIIFRIPQLCMIGSYMAERCINRGLGFSFDPDDENYADKIHCAYKSLDFKQFVNNCDAELTAILSEYNIGKERIKQILNS